MPRDARQPAKHGRDHCRGATDPITCLLTQTAYLARSSNFTLPSSDWRRALASADTSATTDTDFLTSNTTHGYIQIEREGAYSAGFLGQWNEEIATAWMAAIVMRGTSSTTDPGTPTNETSWMFHAPGGSTGADRIWGVAAHISVPLPIFGFGDAGPPVRVWGFVYQGEGVDQVMDRAILTVTRLGDAP